MNTVEQIKPRQAAVESTPLPTAPHPSAVRIWAWLAISVACFHLAWLVPVLRPLIGVFAFGFMHLAFLRSARRAFYGGFVTGLLCYDLSYVRVTDALVRAGAQVLVVPTMDPVEWGRYQHDLHGRIAPVRAAEYGLPIFRVASSGASQAVDPRGRVVASAPFIGERAMLAAEFLLPARGHPPFDRHLAPTSIFLVLALVPVLLFLQDRRKRIAP